MPCRYLIDKERRLIRSTAWDHTTFAEAKAHQDQLKKDPDFNPDFDQLIDVTAITTLDMSIEQAKILGSGSPFFSPTSRRAFVAASPFIFGMARVIQAYAELTGKPQQWNVFYHLSAAQKWLGLNTETEATRTEH